MPNTSLAPKGGCVLAHCSIHTSPSIHRKFSAILAVSLRRGNPSAQHICCANPAQLPEVLHFCNLVRRPFLWYQPTRMQPFLCLYSALSSLICYAATLILLDPAI